MEEIKEKIEIIVKVENRLDNLATISETIGSAGINIESVNAYEKEGYLIFRLLTPDAKSARKLLDNKPGEVSESKILVVRLIDRPGELGKLTKRLARGLVNLEAIYIVSADGRYTYVALKPHEKDYEKVKELLS